MQQRRWKIRKIFIRCAALLIGVFFLFAAILLLFNIFWEFEINNQIREMKAASFPVSVEDFYHSQFNDSENAAVPFREAVEILYNNKNGSQGGCLDKKLDDLVSKIPSNVSCMSELMSWNDADRSKTSEILFSHKMEKVFAKLNESLTRKHLDWGIDYSKGFVISPNYGDIRLLSKLLLLRAFSNAEKHDMDGAFADCISVLKLSSYYDSEPLVIYEISKMAVLFRTLKTIEILIDTHGISGKNAENILSELDKINICATARRAWRGEAALCGIPIFRKAIENWGTEELSFNPKPFWEKFYEPFMLRKDFIVYLDMMRRGDSIFLMPTCEWGMEAEKLHSEIRFYCIKSEIYNLTSVFKKYPACIYEIEKLRLKLALEIYRSRKNVYPDTLNDILPDILQKIPINPINGKAFKYSRIDTGFDLE